jgi:photosystem II stability/assembly factor-like uncharacterized protein
LTYGEAILKRWLSLLFAVIVAASALRGQSKSDARLPFTLSWTPGRCSACQTAQELGRIQFVSRIEAWAIGFHYPQPGEQGAGDFIVVHTKDGGHTWNELRQTAEHAGDEDGPPGFWFLDSVRGWISSWDLVDDPTVIGTADGGHSWQDLSHEFLQKLRFFSDNVGYGTEVTKFFRTGDGGRHWTETQIPELRFIDRMFFLTPEIGWLAGSDGKDFFVFRTSDGGKDWQESRTTPPKEIANVRDLFFLNQNQGWLITRQLNRGGTYLYATADGGKKWVREGDPTFQGMGRLMIVVRFSSESDGFIFENGFGPGATKSLLYTLDGGVHWTKQTVPRSVFDCQFFEGDLLCDAGNKPGDFNLLTVHLK